MQARKNLKQITKFISASLTKELKKYIKYFDHFQNETLRTIFSSLGISSIGREEGLRELKEMLKSDSCIEYDATKLKIAEETIMSFFGESASNRAASLIQTSTIVIPEEEFNSYQDTLSCSTTNLSEDNEDFNRLYGLLEEDFNEHCKRVLNDRVSREFTNRRLLHHMENPCKKVKIYSNYFKESLVRDLEISNERELGLGVRCDLLQEKYDKLQQTCDNLQLTCEKLQQTCENLQQTYEKQNIRFNNSQSASPLCSSLIVKLETGRFENTEEAKFLLKWLEKLPEEIYQNTKEKAFENADWSLIEKYFPDIFEQEGKEQFMSRFTDSN